MRPCPNCVRVGARASEVFFVARIIIKTAAELSKMRRAGKIVAEALELLKQEARPSVRTESLDSMVDDLIRRRGGLAAFKGYRGFPASICTSINEQVVHGIPGPVELKEGDLLSADVGVFFDGYAGDAAITIEIGRCSAEARRLMQVTQEALQAALEVIRAGVRLVEVSRAIQKVAESAGFSVVRQYTGHGIGATLHEEPQVPNFVSPSSARSSPALPRGATIAVEPMLNAGKHQIEVLGDGWTVVTKDRKLSAHFEHTVAVDRQGAVILTLP